MSIQFNDAIDRAKFIQLESHLNSRQCCGACKDTNETCGLMRYVGNDRAKTRSLQIEYLDLGLKSSCSGCADRFFTMSDVFTRHLKMLDYVQKRDDEGAKREAVARGALLKKLGYKIA